MSARAKKNLRAIDKAFKATAKLKPRMLKKAAVSGKVTVPNYISGTSLVLTFIAEPDRVGSKEIMKVLQTNHKRFMRMVKNGKVFSKYYVEPGKKGAFFSRAEFDKFKKNMNPLDYIVAKKKINKKSVKNFDQTYKKIKNAARVITPIGMEREDYKRFLALLRIQGMKAQDFYTEVTVKEYEHLLQTTKIKTV